MPFSWPTLRSPSPPPDASRPAAPLGRRAPAEAAAPPKLAQDSLATAVPSQPAAAPPSKGTLAALQPPQPAQGAFPVEPQQAASRALRAAVLHAQSDPEARFDAWMDFTMQHAASPRALAAVLFPTDPHASLLVQLAEQLVKEPTPNNVAAFAKLFGNMQGVLNNQAAHLSAEVVEARVQPVLAATARGIVAAHRFFEKNAAQLAPDLVGMLGADFPLCMVMESSARLQFNADRSALLAAINASPTPAQRAVQVADATLAQRGLGGLDPNLLKQEFPGLHRALTVLRAETVVMARAARCGIPLDVDSMRGRGSLSGFLERVLQDTEAAQATAGGAPREGRSHDPMGDFHTKVRIARRFRDEAGRLTSDELRLMYLKRAWP